MKRIERRSGSLPLHCAAIVEASMKTLTALIVIMLAGCATCKSSDSPEVCRTKQRNHSQPRLDFAPAGFLTPRWALLLQLTVRTALEKRL
jgi:hypothetical protein